MNPPSNPKQETTNLRAPVHGAQGGSGAGESAAEPGWFRNPRRWVLRSFLAGWQPEDPEMARHVRLITGFGFLGAIFGTLYAAFYFAI